MQVYYIRTIEYGVIDTGVYKAYIVPFTIIHGDGALAVTVGGSDCSSCTRRLLESVAANGRRIENHEVTRQFLNTVLESRTEMMWFGLFKIPEAAELANAIFMCDYYEFTTFSPANGPHMTALVSYDPADKQMIVVSLSNEPFGSNSDAVVTVVTGDGSINNYTVEVYQQFITNAKCNLRF